MSTLSIISGWVLWMAGSSAGECPTALPGPAVTTHVAPALWGIPRTGSQPMSPPASFSALLGIVVDFFRSMQSMGCGPPWGSIAELGNAGPDNAFWPPGTTTGSLPCCITNVWYEPRTYNYTVTWEAIKGNPTVQFPDGDDSGSILLQDCERMCSPIRVTVTGNQYDQVELKLTVWGFGVPSDTVTIHLE